MVPVAACSEWLAGWPDTLPVASNRRFVPTCCTFCSLQRSTVQHSIFLTAEAFKLAGMRIADASQAWSSELDHTRTADSVEIPGVTAQ
eukprot:2667644-Rhodomonas_salina.1